MKSKKFKNWLRILGKRQRHYWQLEKKRLDRQRMYYYFKRGLPAAEALKFLNLDYWEY